MADSRARWLHLCRFGSGENTVVACFGIVLGAAAGRRGHTGDRSHGWGGSAGFLRRCDAVFCVVMGKPCFLSGVGRGMW